MILGHRLAQAILGETCDYRTLGLQLPGGLAQYVTAPASICLEVGLLGLTPTTAALTQPMSLAIHCVSRGRVTPDEKVVVIGAAGIGVFLSYALVAKGAIVDVVERDETRRNLVWSLGVASVSETTQEMGEPDVVFEVTGTGDGLELALGLAGLGTRLVVVGLQEHPNQLDMRGIAIREVELIGTNAHVFAANFAHAARLLSTRAKGWDDVASVILPLDDLVGSGLEPMTQGRPPAVKTLIDPWATAGI